MSTVTTDNEARERFEHDTREHEMTVLKDDGLYRHLRFQKPGTSMYYFDLVTWPGHLVVCGDAGDYHFARIRDMFEFFESDSGRINPHYWAQKLQGREIGRTGARSYSFEAFEARVREWLADALEEVDADDAPGLRAAVQEQILDDPDGYAYHDETEAYRRLHEFEHDGRRIYDPSDWDFREYDWSFLWCCWAIVRGIEQYRAASGSTR